jgi:hypothetical protein
VLVAYLGFSLVLSFLNVVNIRVVIITIQIFIAQVNRQPMTLNKLHSKMLIHNWSRKEVFDTLPDDIKDDCRAIRRLQQYISRAKKETRPYKDEQQQLQLLRPQLVKRFKYFEDCIKEDEMVKEATHARLATKNKTRMAASDRSKLATRKQTALKMELKHKQQGALGFSVEFHAAMLLYRIYLSTPGTRRLIVIRGILETYPADVIEAAGITITDTRIDCPSYTMLQRRFRVKSKSVRRDRRQVSKSFDAMAERRSEDNVANGDPVDFGAQVG